MYGTLHILRTLERLLASDQSAFKHWCETFEPALYESTIAS